LSSADVILSTISTVAGALIGLVISHYLLPAGPCRRTSDDHQSRRAAVLCTYWKSAAPPTSLTDTELRFFPGLDSQFTARGDGLLKNAAVLQD
jgi:hypothetical protein